MRKTAIITGNVYHIFNRGVNKDQIFFSDDDYRRFLLAAIHYRTKRSKFSYEKLNQAAVNDPGSLPARVCVIAYCLMPNHFHFLIQQLENGGLASYLQQLMSSYVHHVNLKRGRVGPLFQGRFKNVWVQVDAQLMHISRYIHLNPFVSDLVDNLDDYRWSSYTGYLGKARDRLCDPNLVLGLFPSVKVYQGFVLDHAGYAKALEKIKHLKLD